MAAATAKHTHLTVELGRNLSEGLDVLRGPVPRAAYIRDIIRVTRNYAADDVWLLRVVDGAVLYREEAFDNPEEALKAVSDAIELCMQWDGPWTAVLSRVAAVNVPYQHPEGGIEGGTLSLSLPPAELEIVDYNRGNLARATYVRHILMQQMRGLDTARGALSRAEFVQKMLEEREE